MSECANYELSWNRRVISDRERNRMRRRAERGSFTEEDAHALLDELDAAYQASKKAVSLLADFLVRRTDAEDQALWAEIERMGK